MRGSSAIMFGLLAAAAFSAGVAGQALNPPYEPVDEAVADVNPLSASLRDPRFDLRQPLEFERVYRVPNQSDLLMRINGGIFAVFPQSIYARAGDDESAQVPPGTIFYIGLPLEYQARPPLLSHPTRITPRSIEPIDTALIDRTDEPPLDSAPAQRVRLWASPPPPTNDEPTMANSAEYRQRRIDELLALATRASVVTPDTAADE